MKKIVASVGLIALGVSNFNAVHGQDVATPPYKPWNVSASLRAFYDDNINTVPNGPNKTGSFGFQVSPGVGLDWHDDQTSLKLDYLYTLRWYDKRPFASDNYDQDHQFNASFGHAFNERYQLGVTESFVIGQEPEMLRSGLFAPGEFQRVSGDNIRNYGTITLNGQLTPLFGFEAGYANQFYDYHDSGASVFGGIVGRFIGGTFVPGPSYSGSLDRIVHNIHLDSRWQITPQTVGVLGYAFELTDYTGNEPIAVVSQKIGTNAPTPLVLNSDSRNSRANYIYGGADHNFGPDLSGSIRVGIRDTDYYNDPTAKSAISPYVNSSLKYNYQAESYAEAGFSFDRTPTDMVAASSTDVTRDSDSAVIFGHINHRIVPDLFGSLLAQFQNSTFNGGSFDGKSERYFMLGLDLTYRFNPYLSADIGYNYDKVDSDISGRSYDRNRVYIGMTARY
jgi:hypothetical protein